MNYIIVFYDKDVNMSSIDYGALLKVDSAFKNKSLFERILDTEDIYKKAIFPDGKEYRK